MGRIVGYEKTHATVSYDVGYRLPGSKRLFLPIGGERHYVSVGIFLKTAQKALEIAYKIRAIHRTPEITRRVRFPLTNNGGWLLNIKNPDPENITIRRLEEIIKNDENIPAHIEPIVVYTGKV